MSKILKKTKKYNKKSYKSKQYGGARFVPSSLKMMSERAKSIALTTLEKKNPKLYKTLEEEAKNIIKAFKDGMTTLKTTKTETGSVIATASQLPRSMQATARAIVAGPNAKSVVRQTIAPYVLSFFMAAAAEKIEKSDLGKSVEEQKQMAKQYLTEIANNLFKEMENFKIPSAKEIQNAIKYSNKFLKKNSNTNSRNSTSSMRRIGRSIRNMSDVN